MAGKRLNIGAGEAALGPRKSRRSLAVLLALVVFSITIVLMNKRIWTEAIGEAMDHTAPVASAMGLPENLEEVTVAQFDKLLNTGKIFYEPTQPESLSHNGFQVRD